jgi:signal peptidase II
MKRILLISGLIVFNIVIDQVSKFWVRANVVPRSQESIVGDWFTLHNVENSGAFLGMGSDFNPTLKLILLLILPIVVLGYVLFYIIKNKELDRLSIIGFSCIIGGGVANVYDRIVYGSVTDFFHLDFGGVFRTGIFNIADMSVTGGMIMIVAASFIYKKPTESTPVL